MEVLNFNFKKSTWTYTQINSILAMYWCGYKPKQIAKLLDIQQSRVNYLLLKIFKHRTISKIKDDELNEIEKDYEIYPEGYVLYKHKINHTVINAIKKRKVQRSKQLNATTIVSVARRWAKKHVDRLSRETKINEIDRNHLWLLYTLLVINKFNENGIENLKEAKENDKIKL